MNSKNESDQKLLEQIIDSTPDLIFIKDREHRYLKVNAGYAKALHMEPSEFIGKNDLDLGFPEELVKGNPQKGIMGFWPLDQKVMNAGRTIALENDPVLLDGKIHTFHTIKTPLRNNKNEIYAVLGFARDITELVQLQQSLDYERMKSIQTARLASLGEMAAGVAHEINNPLAIISAAVGLLSKYADQPEKLAAKIDSIQKSCDRISRIVAGLKKFSRSGEKTNFKYNEITKIVYESLDLVRTKATRHDTRLIIECRSTATVFCDDVEIEQVLINLINNSVDAIKKLDEKWVKIESYDDREVVVLRVTDSGLGIPEHVRTQMFQPFFTTKALGEGTGLGLSISKGILDDHKATISIIDSDPNTCFEIRFPIAKEPR